MISAKIRYIKRLLVLGLLILLVTAVSMSASGQASPSLPNLEIVILLDESGSMRTTDPEFWRNDAVEKFIGSLGVELSASNFHLSVVTFSTTATSVTGSDAFTDLKDPQQRQTLRDSFLNRNSEYVWTDVLAGLKKAQTILNSRNMDYKPVIILITDGQPETEFATRGSYGTEEAHAAFPGYIDEVKTFATTAFQSAQYGDETTQCGITRGIPIYTLAIRRTNVPGEFAYSDSDKQLWEDIANLTGGTYYEILAENDADFLRNLVTVFSNMQRQMLCTSATESDFESLPEGATVIQQFDVSSIHDSFVLDISKTNSNVQVTIKNAVGTVVGRTGDETHRSFDSDRSVTTSGLLESWSYGRPEKLDGWEGKWTVEFVNGQGSLAITPEVKYAARFSSDAFSADLVQPATRFFPVGGQLAMAQQVTALSSAPAIQAAEFVFTCIDGRTYELVNRPEISGPTIKYLLDLTAAEPSSCQMLTKLTMATQTGSVVIPYKYDVILDTYPRIDIASPVNGRTYSRSALPELRAQAFVGQDKYSAASGKDEVLVTIYPAGESLSGIPIPLPKGEEFKSPFPTSLSLVSDKYCARFELRAFPPGASDFLPSYYSESCFTIVADELTSTLELTPPPGTMVAGSPISIPVTPSPCSGSGCVDRNESVSSTLLIFLAGLMVALLGLFFSWLMRRPIGHIREPANVQSNNNKDIQRSLIPFVKPIYTVHDAVGRPLSTFAVDIRTGNRVYMTLKDRHGAQVVYKGQVRQRGNTWEMLDRSKLMVADVELEFRAAGKQPANRTSEGL